jgi:hypothetical protein
MYMSEMGGIWIGAAKPRSGTAELLIEALRADRESVTHSGKKIGVLRTIGAAKPRLVTLSRRSGQNGSYDHCAVIPIHTKCARSSEAYQSAQSAPIIAKQSRSTRSVPDQRKAHQQVKSIINNKTKSK